MKKLFFITSLLFPIFLFSQTISGKVTSGKETLVGANVHWAGTTNGVTTDANGKFTIANNGDYNQLVASFVGYISDTITVTFSTSEVIFNLKSSQILNEITIQEDREGIVLSDLTPMKTEQINEIELEKAACCDLAGCFETQLTVQPQTTNVITNSKELRILGLSGRYNQILIDGFPLVQGLSYTYGISSIPGTLVSNIFVSKGANSVIQGFEGMSGQINVITKDPRQTDQLMINGYMNSFLEKQFNANYAFKKGRWSNLTAFQTVQPANKIDRDGDQFLDLPLLTRYMLYNKLQYGNSSEWGWHSKIGLRFYKEERVGGQTFFDPQADLGSTNAYGQVVNINQPEIYTKTGYRFDDTHHLVFFASAYQQKQDSYFGTVKYNALQTNYYVNAQYELNYKKHNLKTGISYRYFDLVEDIAFTGSGLNRSYDGDYRKLENIAGAFVENTLNFFDDKLTWMAGVRGDYHDQFRFMFTPRTLLKYRATDYTIIRANVGTGWRTANIFSENINLLVSSRDVVFQEELNPERTLNYGINVTQKFETDDENLKGSFTVDFYRTEFQNQIFPDYDTDPTLAVIRNFTGKSVSNGLQAELYLKLWKRVEVKTGYNFLEVYREVGDTKELLPFNAMHKVMGSVSFQPLSKKFHIDVNVHWYGRKRLPNTSLNPVEYQRPDYSQPYTLLNAQFTYNFKFVEVYTGCENILNFRQNRPIISWEDPFSPYFDTSSVWGPTKGRRFYLGFRFKLNLDES